MTCHIDSPRDTHCNLSQRESDTHTVHAWCTGTHTATCHTGTHTATCHTGTHTATCHTGTHSATCRHTGTHTATNLSHRNAHCNVSHKDPHCNQLVTQGHTLQPTCHTGTHTATNLSHRATYCNVSHRDPHCNQLVTQGHTLQRVTKGPTLQPTCHTGTHTATCQTRTHSATNLSHRDSHCNVSHRTRATLIHNNTRLTFEIPISFTTKSFPESFCLTRRALPNEPSPIFFTRSNLSITRAAVEGGTINTPFCDRLRAHTYFYCQTTSHAHMHV